MNAEQRAKHRARITELLCSFYSDRAAIEELHLLASELAGASTYGTEREFLVKLVCELALGDAYNARIRDALATFQRADDRAMRALMGDA